MSYRYITCNHIVNKITRKDNLFLGYYTVDPYQNCEFGCVYCDSSFDKTIYVKTNACELLDKELANLEKGCIIIGSVHDPYQKIEEKQEITRKLLEIVQKHGFSCHILTKSNLVLRDIDILLKIENCIVTISILSVDNSISNIFEKNLPSPKKRLETIKRLSKQGINAGVAVMPLLPFIVNENIIEETIKSATAYNAQYVLYKYLELKGEQKQIFIDLLQEAYPGFVKKYEGLYENNYMPDDSYICKINDIVAGLCSKYNIKNRI